MDQQLAENLVFEEHFACFRPVGEVTLDQAAEMINEAIKLCVDQAVRGLLVNITALTGFGSPSLTARFNFITKWSATNGGRVAMAMIAPPEMIDHEKIGNTIASNRGMRSNVFPTESEAISWLLSQL